MRPSRRIPGLKHGELLARIAFALLSGALAAQEGGRSAFESAKKCAGCHAAHFKEWKDSPHAHFSKPSNVPFDRLLEARERLEGVKLAGCTGTCHQPVHTFLGAGEQAGALSAEMVTCDFCHSARIDEQKRALVRSPGGAKLGPVKEVRSPPHPVSYSDDHTRSQFCMVWCHSKIIGEYKQYLAASPGKPLTCQDCHMPPRPKGAKGRSHTFPGGFSEEMLQKSVRLDVTASRNNAGIEAEVSVKNIVEAHYVPTGSNACYVVLEVNARDKKNASVWRNWKANPLEESREAIFSRVLADASGRAPAAPFLPGAKLVLDGRLKNTETRKVRYRIPDRDVSSIDARLTYYSFHPEMAAALGLAGPLYTSGRTMAFRKVVLPRSSGQGEIEK